MSEQQEPELLQLARRLTALAIQRTEVSSERSYLNSERTLAALVHTAAVLMILGLAIDRYQLLPHQLPEYRHLITGTLTSWSAAVLIGLGVLMALTSGLRYLFFILEYRRRHVLLLRYGPLIAPVIAFVVSTFGLALLVALFTTGS